MKKYYFVVALTTLVLQSCATLSGSHPHKMQTIKNDFQRNTPLLNSKAFEEAFPEDGKSADVNLLEKGRYYQLLNHNQKSIKDYSAVIKDVRQAAMEPLIRATRIAQSTAAIATSDRELDYAVPDYAVSFLFAYQALNYLKENNISDATVSIRNLSDAQDARRYQEELNSKMQEQNKGMISKVFNTSALSSYLASSGGVKDINKIAIGAKNSYANPLAYYLEAIIYEAFDHDYNNAYLSIQNANDAVIDNKYVSKTLELFKNGYNGGKAYDDNAGRLTVIYESGFVQPIDRCEIRLPMDTALFASAMFQASIPAAKVSLPCYKLKNRRSIVPVDIKVSGNNIQNVDSMDVLVDTTAMAAKSLQEAYPAILTREIARLATKTISTVVAANAARRSSKDNGQLAGLAVVLAGSVYQYFTTVADQRSWVLLPQDAQLYVASLPGGKYSVNINGIKKDVKIQNYKNTLLWVTTTGKYNTVQYNNFL